MAKQKVKPIEKPDVNELLKLKRQHVKLDQIFLDPNNPRFGEDLKIPDSRIHEDSIQRDCKEKIDVIGITDLLLSFKQHGFVPTDPIVIRKFAQNRYVVVEGNRRTATLKKLIVAHEKGESFDDAALASFQEFEALLYEGHDPNISWLLQGLRHMSGIKEWPPFQQGAFLAKIEQEISGNGTTTKPAIGKVAKAAGISAPRATRLLRSHSAYIEASKDEEYGDMISEEKFAMFTEAVFVSSQLQTWLGWNEETRKFDKKENFRSFLSWITPADSESQPRLSRAVDARDVLPSIVEDADMLARFEGAEITIDEARVEIQKRRASRPEDLDVLLRRLGEMLGTLDSLPTPQIIREKRQADFLLKLKNIQTTVEQHIKTLQG